MILGDEQYQSIIDQVLQHDLTGYDVYLVGGILYRNADDLDITIVGEWDYERLAAIFEPLSAVDKLDLFWQKEPPSGNAASMIKKRVKVRKWVGFNVSLRKQSLGQFFGGFLQIHIVLPTVKAKVRKYDVKEPILLIQNGEQIYF